MSLHSLIISPLALGDLKNIFQYGINSLHRVEATSYLDRLKERLWHLTEYPEIGRPRDDLLPLMRSLVVEQHVVFYQVREKQISVVRILHSRQDPQIHIK